MKNYLTLFVLCTLTSLILIGCGGDTPGLEGNENNSNGSPTCGDGVLDPGELCDNGEANSDTKPDACRANCYLPHCGDGVVDSDEECDGDDKAGAICSDFGSFTHGALSCTQTCTLNTSSCATCGDGQAEGEEGEFHYETCDGSDLRGQDCISIGQAQGVLRCDSGCGWDISGCVGGGTTCGDGNLEPGEQCDDGNTIACDGCSPTCIIEVCGNGVMECNEQCDDNNSSNEDFCLNNCTLNTCGDGHVWSGVEECDDGNHGLNDTCPDGPLGTCLNASCGDGFVQAGVEMCDDGNGSNTDACPDGPLGTCEQAFCGDGFVQAGVEMCDEAADPTCHNNCQSFCGDGVTNSLYEECDDNFSCSSDCQRYCGDGVLDTDLGEVCDEGIFEYPYDGGPLDGNMTGGNSATCLANCTPSSCGDGFCNIHWDDDERDFCAQDCVCADWNRDQCETECCSVGEVCCGVGLGCTVQHSATWCEPNCGTCGNACEPGYYCTGGTCTLPP